MARSSIATAEAPMFCPNPECLDFVEGGVHGEYVDTVTTCPVCGARLVETLPDEHGDRLQTHDASLDAGPACGAPVAVAAFRSRQEAELAMSLLEANGITVFESVDDVGGTYPDMGLSGGTRLLVPEPQVAAAVALLESAPETQ
jgi:hypothetical protein